MIDNKHLKNWLEKHEPACLWQLSDKTKTVNCYALNGKTFFVVIFHVSKTCSGGWDIYKPVTNTNDVVTTLEQLTEYVS